MSQDKPINPADFDPKYLPATIPAGPNLPAQMSGPRQDYWCSWPAETEDDKAAIYDARNSGSIMDLSDHKDKVIEVRGIVCYLVPDFESRDGPITLRRTVLICPNGELYGCSSDLVIESVRDLVFAKGQGPWDPPLKLRAFTGKGKVGEWMKLEWLRDKPGTTPKPKEPKRG